MERQCHSTWLLTSPPFLSPYNHAFNGQCCAAVADQLGNPPVQPGDALMLMSGNYGDVSIGNFNQPTTNSDFVTVEAAPGQTPVFTTLLLDRTNKWVFNAIKVQSLMGTNGNTQALVGLTDQGAAYPTMAGNGTNGEPNTRCISLAGSHIQNVRFGAILAANNLLFTNNVIDHFGDDGIDYAANNLAITHNTIHDNLDLGDGNHEDAMQGQNGPLAAGAALNYFSNILIDSNLVVRQTDPQLAFPTYLQGIDAFDEDWTNVTVTNNVVITSACHGITFTSIHNSLIANNTVLNDGLFPMPGCIAAINVGGASHEGPLSTNTIVRNNLTSQLNIDTRNIGVVPDHNVVLCCGPGPFISWSVNGVAQFLSQPGTYMNGNIIETEGAKGEFVNFNPATLTYTVLLKSSAQAIGAGVAGAPTIDIAGVTRTAPYAAGAYSYPF
jgi:Right handed beta helix region